MSAKCLVRQTRLYGRYNQSVRSLLPVLVCLALAGCHHNIQNEEAVKQGVMDYLATRQGLNIASMNVSVTSIVFRQDAADVVVTFSPKQGGAAQPMSIAYRLEKTGDKWVVQPRTGGSPHAGAGAGAGANPHGDMGTPEGGGSPGGALPPGHPTIPPGSGSK